MSKKIKSTILSNKSILLALVCSIGLHTLLLLSGQHQSSNERDFSVAYASQKKNKIVKELSHKKRTTNPLHIKKALKKNKRKRPTKTSSSRFTSSKVRHLNRSIQNRITYPQFAIRRAWQGRVSIELKVSAAGQPKQIQVTRSSGYELLDNTAIDAIRNWAFAKGERDEDLALHFAFRLQ